MPGEQPYTPHSCTIEAQAGKKDGNNALIFTGNAFTASARGNLSLLREINLQLWHSSLWHGRRVPLRGRFPILLCENENLREDECTSSSNRHSFFLRKLQLCFVFAVKLLSAGTASSLFHPGIKKKKKQAADNELAYG